MAHMEVGQVRTEPYITATIAIAAIAASIATAALASDMAIKSPPSQTAPALDWSGFYVGGFTGIALASSAYTTDPCPIGSTCPPAGSFDGVEPASYSFNTSIIDGVVIGYNWQANPHLVVGLEDKLGYLKIHGSGFYTSSPPFGPFPGGPQVSAFTTYGDWYDAFLARIGATVGQAIIFLEGGGVATRIQTGFIDTVTRNTLTISINKTETSWAFGGGLQYVLDKHWSLEGEIIALGLQNPVTGCAAALNGNTVWCSQTKTGDVTVVDVGLDYAFK